MRKSKNRYFYHIFVFPGDAPGAITLNVVWMKREYDAYKLSCCMCPSKYNRFWDTAIYSWKNRQFFIHLVFDAPLGGFPSEYRHPLWYGKTRMASLPHGENISKISLFFFAQLRNVTDRQTDTVWQHIPRLCICIKQKKRRSSSSAVPASHKSLRHRVLYFADLAEKTNKYSRNTRKYLSNMVVTL